jgi:hypothetical protein
LIVHGFRWLSTRARLGLPAYAGHKSDLFGPNIGQDWIAEYMAILAKAVANPDKELGRLADL